MTGIGENVLSTGAQIGTSVASGLGGIASQYGQANEFNAAGQTNPFASIAQFLASLGGGGGLGGGGTGGANVGGSVPDPGSANQFGWNPWSSGVSLGTPQAGQGGLGLGG